MCWNPKRKKERNMKSKGSRMKKKQKRRGVQHKLPDVQAPLSQSQHLLTILSGNGREGYVRRRWDWRPHQEGRRPCVKQLLKISTVVLTQTVIIKTELLDYIQHLKTTHHFKISDANHSVSVRNIYLPRKSLWLLTAELIDMLIDTPCGAEQPEERAWERSYLAVE